MRDSAKARSALLLARHEPRLTRLEEPRDGLYLVLHVGLGPNVAGDPAHRLLEEPRTSIRQTHNLKVVGSNPTPATTEALENIDVFKGFLRVAPPLGPIFNRR